MALVTRWVRIISPEPHWHQADVGNTAGFRGQMISHIWTDNDLRHANWGVPAVSFCPVEVTPETAKLLDKNINDKGEPCVVDIADVPVFDRLLGLFQLGKKHPKKAADVRDFFQAQPVAEKYASKNVLLQFAMYGCDCEDAQNIQAQHSLPASISSGSIDADILRAKYVYGIRECKHRGWNNALVIREIDLDTGLGRLSAAAAEAMKQELPLDAKGVRVMS